MMEYATYSLEEFHLRAAGVCCCDEIRSLLDTTRLFCEELSVLWSLCHHGIEKMDRDLK